MKLFDLFATLSLDTSSFTDEADNAIKKSQEIASSIDQISTENVGNDITILDKEIAALDAEIASLDDEIHQLTMASLDDMIADSDREIMSLGADIDSLDGKAKLAETAIVTAVEVGKELATAALETLFQFSTESLDFVAESGSYVGEQLKKSRADWRDTVNVLQMQVGTYLAPLEMGLLNLAEAMAGVTSQDKLLYMLGELDSYKFENIQAMEARLRGVFSMFEQYESPEGGISLGEMAQGIDSQIRYWEEYEEALASLQSRGLDANVIASMADGSVQSLGYLQAIANASDKEIEALNEAFSRMEEARESAAATIGEAQMSVDDVVAQMNTKIAQLGVDVAVDQGATNVYNAAQGIISSLSTSYPGIAAQVDMINSKLAEIGSFRTIIAFATNDPSMIDVSGSGESRAVGLDYVPYDDYAARLHEGEAVLTKSEATAWRRGEGQGVDMRGLADDIKSAVREGLAGMSVTMDGQSVGNVVTKQVSRNIARQTHAGRFAT